MRRAWSAVLSSVCLLGLSGCPLTDDYYLESSPPGAGGRASVEPRGGAGSMLEAGSSAAGDSGRGSAGVSGAGGALGQACVPKTERCNGHDDDCDGFRDEAACGVQGTFGCLGFTLSDREDHGYMLCSATKRDLDDAQQACAAQDMRLAWIETAAENAQLAAKLSALGGVTEVLLGATDQDEEGDWAWIDGRLFWLGAADGAAVDDAFEAWADATPNNMNNEDCLLFFPALQTWGDRSCSAAYSYLCEEREPGE